MVTLTDLDDPSCPCRELGKVLTGKLVVVTPDSEHTFIVKGRQPAYVPPSRSALPSSKFLTAGTASSMAHSRSSSPALRDGNRSSSPGGTGAAAAAAGRTARSPEAPAGQQQQRSTQQGTATGTGSKNYLQQNIKAARVGAGSKHSSGAGQGGPRQWA
jgi:hypothetical protein